MISFNEYLNEGVKGDTSENVVRIIKNLCHRDFKFIESSRYGDDIRFLIKSVDGNVTITYDNAKAKKFNVGIYSQNLDEDSMDSYAKLIAKTQELINGLAQLERAGRFDVLERSRG